MNKIMSEHCPDCQNDHLPNKCESCDSLRAQARTGETVTEELKPCPFCGSRKVNIMTRLHEIKSFDGYCLDCDCSGPQFLTKKGAIAAWNRRVPAAQPAQKQGDES